ncbi:MAG: hypothetical protein U5Q03_01310 [Bacteroidota bacterium]|nr:hypothetical protein [Bacteroidota bacterium]
MGAIRICDSLYVEDNAYLGSGNFLNEIPSSGACPGNCMYEGELNDVWYRIMVEEDGFLGFIIDPQSYIDFDWVVYNLTDARCEDIFSQAEQLQLSCSYSGIGGFTGPNGLGYKNCANPSDGPFNELIPVFKDEIYVINVSNWSGSQDGYILDFSSSTVGVLDTTSPHILKVQNEELHTGDDEIQIKFNEFILCSTLDANDFILNGPNNSNYKVEEISGIYCILGAPTERLFTLLLDKPLQSPGIYKLSISQNAAIMDECNNTSNAHHILFTVDLQGKNPGPITGKKTYTE